MVLELLLATAEDDIKNSVQWIISYYKMQAR